MAPCRPGQRTQSSFHISLVEYFLVPRTGTVLRGPGPHVRPPRGWGPGGLAGHSFLFINFNLVSLGSDPWRALQRVALPGLWPRPASGELSQESGNWVPPPFCRTVSGYLISQGWGFSPRIGLCGSPQFGNARVLVLVPGVLDQEKMPGLEVGAHTPAATA